MKKSNKIEDILLDDDYIDAGQMKAAQKKFAATGQPIEKILLDMGIISESQMVDALSKKLNIPVFDKEEISINDDLLGLLPTGFLLKNSVLPVERRGKKIKIAMANPLNYATIKDIEFTTGLIVEPMIAGVSSIEYLIEHHFSKFSDVRQFLKHVKPTEHVEIIEDDEIKEEEDVRKLAEVGRATSIIHLVNKILSDSCKAQASDIHIEPRAKEVLIRNRIDGILQTMTRFPISLHASLISRLKIISKLDISVQRRPQDGGTKIKLGNREVDLRISTIPTTYGEKMVIRILDKGQTLKKLKDLGMSASIEKTFCSLLNRPQGMILVTGPTGSGKTTTLYAALNHVLSDEVNVITIEDPVEYNMDGVNQVKVNEKAGITFAAGLRSVLRQDPNIIMVGEIRDRETATIAFQASLTGHLVFSTLHTNNAICTITRLVDIGIEPYMLASSLTGVVAQRLVRRNCPHCLKAYIPEPAVLERYKIDPKDIGRTLFYHGEGCRKCNYIGYSGRIGIFEILRVNDTIRHLITKRSTERKLLSTARKIGMTTMEENGLYLALKKVTTLEEILRVIPPEEIGEKKKPDWIKRVNQFFDDADILPSRPAQTNPSITSR